MDKKESVLQRWVVELPYKMQTALMTSIRGGDGLSTYDLSKPIIKALRTLIVKIEDPYTNYASSSVSNKDIDLFCADIDKYTVHFISHLYQGIEVVAYNYPDDSVKIFWLKVYTKIAESICLNIETKEELENRMK